MRFCRGARRGKKGAVLKKLMERLKLSQGEGKKQWRCLWKSLEIEKQASHHVPPPTHTPSTDLF